MRDAWAASKLHNASTDVEGVKLKRGEVVYCAIEDAGLVELRRAEVPTVTDTGSFVVTNQRCVFVGSKRSTDWSYSKLLGYSLDGEAVAMFDVSNRQNATGVKYRLENEPRSTPRSLPRSPGSMVRTSTPLSSTRCIATTAAFAEWEVAGSHVPPTA